MASSMMHRIRRQPLMADTRSQELGSAAHPPLHVPSPQATVGPPELRPPAAGSSTVPRLCMARAMVHRTNRDV